MRRQVCALAVVLALGIILPARAQDVGLGAGAGEHESGFVFPEMPQPPVPVDEVARDVVDVPRIPTELPAAEPLLGPELAKKIAAERRVEPKYDVGRIGMRGVGGGMNFYSIERETAMGRDLAGQVEGSARLLSDPLVTEYVNRLGQNLVRNSDARVPFIIKVIDSDEVNAFALPGGFFYVNSGLILAADNEAELAGVMAHEIAHVAARHATKNQTKADIFNLASIPLIFVGGPAGYAARQVAGLLVPMGFMKFSRNAEREADLLGMEYMYASGYDPGAFLEFFEKLDSRVKEKKSFLAKAFSTHPMTGDRIRDAQKTIDRYLPEREQYVVTTSEFEQVRARLMALESRRMVDVGVGRPKLRTRSGGGTSDGGDGPVLRKPAKPN